MAWPAQAAPRAGMANTNQAKSRKPRTPPPQRQSNPPPRQLNPHQQQRGPPQHKLRRQHPRPRKPRLRNQHQCRTQTPKRNPRCYIRLENSSRTLSRTTTPAQVPARVTKPRPTARSPQLHRPHGAVYAPRSLFPQSHSAHNRNAKTPSNNSRAPASKKSIHSRS
jgi:hypothetical protein